MEIDVNEMRQVMVDCFQLRRTNDKFTFYYDETNNIRKFYLTEDGTNVAEHNNFVLGGIVLTEGQTLPDINLLRDELRMHDNAPEIKFAHVAKGSFEQVLNSHKLRTVLTWIIDHGIAIHYSSLNIIYWALVDIIDSVLAEDIFEDYRPHHEPIKNELYRLVSRNKPAFLSLMRQHRYPNIQRGMTADFISDVGSFLDEQSLEDDRLPTLMLKALIEKSSSLPELVFLVDEEEDILIESFHDFYTRPIMLFKNAVHIFDHELKIEKCLDGLKFKDGHRYVDFSFSDSKNEPGIQIADVVTGFIGKYQAFVEEYPLPELINRKNSWNETQISNFNMLRHLIDISDEVSNAFIHRTTAMDSLWKNDAFMHGLRPMSHLL